MRDCQAGVRAALASQFIQVVFPDKSEAKNTMDDKKSRGKFELYESKAHMSYL